MTRLVRTLSLLLTGGALALGATACKRATATSANVSSTDAEPLHDAVKQVNDVIVYDILSPPQASRVYAYASIAAYEVLRQSDSSYRTLAGQVNDLTAIPARAAGEDISLPLAGVHAYMTVGRTLTFSQARMDTLRRAMDERFRADLSAETFDRSLAYGDTVAKHVLAWAGKDGFRQRTGLPKYSVMRDAPGRWIPTPPAYMDAVEPNWGTLRPFTMDTSNQFRPEPPLPFDTSRTSAFWKQMVEVQQVGKSMTEEQRAIAAFWDCNPFVMHVQGHTMFATKKMSPGGHWMGIARMASHKANADILRASEAYALTAAALADGFLSVWAEKYASSLVRPETVINTYLDEGWQPLLQTPPFPEYTSGHSGISTAAAVVLTKLFGDDFSFADSTEVEYGLPVRSYTSFHAAANEAAISRLYGGIHFRRAVEQGQVQGRKVGELVVSKLNTRVTPAVASAR
ncbi:MAG TPA: vanadium-dependent haloperoxidase [Gemmatimonadaceae bacterium]|nr:vanadium-dependent haloperoxidase [Gemmatimonadaceae bacterium]